MDTSVEWKYGVTTLDQCASVSGPGIISVGLEYSLHVPNASVYDLIAIVPGLLINATYNPCAYLYFAIPYIIYFNSL